MISKTIGFTPTPNGFADHYPYEKWLAIIGKINPTLLFQLYSQYKPLLLVNDHYPYY